MELIPAIDLLDGKVVRLHQGKYDEVTIYDDDPVAMARRWVDAGCRRLHLVDLNGAFAGEPVNGGAIRAIAAAHPDLPIQVGGGIRETPPEALMNGLFIDVLAGLFSHNLPAVQNPLGHCKAPRPERCGKPAVAIGV